MKAQEVENVGLVGFRRRAKLSKCRISPQTIAPNPESES